MEAQGVFDTRALLWELLLAAVFLSCDGFVCNLLPGGKGSTCVFGGVGCKPRLAWLCPAESLIASFGNRSFTLCGVDEVT